MLVYANQTPEATEALPPFVTIVVEAIVFQSVTTFCACKRCIVSNAVARHTKVRKHFIRFSYDVCLRPTRRSATTSECLKRPQFENSATHVLLARQTTDHR